VDLTVMVASFLLLKIRLSPRHTSFHHSFVAGVYTRFTGV
jgi:hypothetical protein